MGLGAQSLMIDEKPIPISHLREGRPTLLNGWVNAYYKLTPDLVERIKLAKTVGIAFPSFLRRTDVHGLRLYGNRRRETETDRFHFDMSLISPIKLQEFGETRPHLTPVERRACHSRAATPALLKGLLFGPTGGPWFPPKLAVAASSTATTSAGRAERRGGRRDDIRHVSAASIEAAVADQLRNLLKSPEVVMATWRAATAEGAELSEEVVREALSGSTRSGRSCSLPSRPASSSFWSSGSTSRPTGSNCGCEGRGWGRLSRNLVISGGSPDARAASGRHHHQGPVRRPQAGWSVHPSPRCHLRMATARRQTLNLRCRRDFLQRLRFGGNKHLYDAES